MHQFIPSFYRDGKTTEVRQIPDWTLDEAHLSAVELDDEVWMLDFKPQVAQFQNRAQTIH